MTIWVIGWLFTLGLLGDKMPNKGWAGFTASMMLLPVWPLALGEEAAKVVSKL